MKSLFLTGAKAIARHFGKLNLLLSLKATDSINSMQALFGMPHVIILIVDVLFFYRAVKPEVHLTALVL